MGRKRILIAGGSGFIGRALTAEFSARGCEVMILTRRLSARGDGVQEILWDGRTAGEWAQFLEGAEAVVNLAGRSIDCPHTAENLREIVASRVDSVKVLAAALAQVKTPPRVWLQAGAAGFYGDTRDRGCDETAPPGNDQLADVCRQWEQAFDSAHLPSTRKVILRIGFVLGRDGGALPILARLARWHLGGSAGNGRQFISWIHLADLVGMFARALADETLTGTFNAVGPVPVTNAEFMRELRRALHRPWSPPAPALAVKWGARLMGTEPSLALASQRCIPKRFLVARFQFQYPYLQSALKNLFEYNTYEKIHSHYRGFRRP